MKIKRTKIIAAALAMSLLLGFLTACGDNGSGDTATLETMAPEDNTWRDALPSSENGSTETDAYETETQVSQTVLTGASTDGKAAFGSSGNDTFSCVTADKDGGFAAIGVFGTANGDCGDANPEWSGTKSMLVKYDKDHKVEWSVFLGGDDGVTFNGLAQLADKSYIVVGQTRSSTLGVKPEAVMEGLIVKYSSAGKLEWTKLFGGTKNEYFSSVAATPDGGFIAGGKTESSNGDFAGLKADTIKAVLIKFDSAGSPRWKRSLYGKMHSNIEGIAVNGTGDIFAACVTMSNDGSFSSIAGRGNADTVILKYDKNGAFKWVRSFSGSGTDELPAIAPSPDGGCVVAGRYSIDMRNDGSFKNFFNAGSFDAFLVKYNSNGTIGWAKPAAGFLNDRITGIAAVDGGYAVTGATESNNRDFAYIGGLGEQDGFLMLIDELGKVINTIALAGSKDDLPRAVSCANGLNIIVAGGTMSDDSFFIGLEPAAGTGTYNCFTAYFSTSF